MNRYPIWKYLLIIVAIIAGFIYAAPNLYGEYPAVQITATGNTIVDNQTLQTATDALKKAAINYEDTTFQDQSLLFRFASTDDQLRAKEVLQDALDSSQYAVALNLAAATPDWLRTIGAAPMKLGLDLRGGVHFLLQVDVDTAIKQRVDGDMRGIGQALREERIRYAGINRKADNEIILQFRSDDAMASAYDFVTKRYREFTWTKQNSGSELSLHGVLSPPSIFQARQETLEQAMTTLRNRVNELGVSEAIVQQQGNNRVSVDLPGIQDTAEAKNILGKTATIEYHMVDVDHDRMAALREGAPPDTKIYEYQGQPYLIKNQIVLRGSSIISASSGFDENGKPSVQIRLKGMGDSLFTKVTAENIGKPMAVIFIEVKSKSTMVDGKPVVTYQTERKVISIATINSALGSSFQITGLMGANEARQLALLLRAGALPATVTIIEERQVGPSLGQQNIHMGMLSVEVGMGLVVVFMALYYGLMGIVADIALSLNLVLIVAILSLLGATLTLPGIAGIVLTVGMAVDANVLIFERIREELRRGAGVQASIHAGYERAFVTILDANITTLIVMMILFSLGSGMIKGIAITVTIGLITSMFTAITGTRALVNLMYGGRPIKRISIGI